MRSCVKTSGVAMGIFTSHLAGATNWTAADTSGSDALWTSSLSNLEAVVNNGSLADYLGTMNVTQTCDLADAAVRKDYSTLTDAEKLAYSDAVKCLFSESPVCDLALTPPPLIPRQEGQASLIVWHLGRPLICFARRAVAIR